MEKDIEKIEKFLRGQMNQKEEMAFKSSLKTDACLSSYAFIVSNMLRWKKSC